MIGLKSPIPSRTSYMPKYVPKAGDGCVLYLEGQSDAHSSTIRDISGNGNNGTLVASPTWVRNKMGMWVLDCESGSSQYVDCGVGTGLNITSNITVMAWVKLESATGATQLIVSRYVDGTNNSYELLVLNAGLVARFYTGDDAGNQSAIGGGLATGVWCHLAGVYDGATNIYTNGVVGTAAVTPIAPVDSPLQHTYLGTRLTIDRFLDGQVALVKIFNVALPSTKIIGFYNMERHLFGV